MLQTGQSSGNALRRKFLSVTFCDAGAMGTRVRQDKLFYMLVQFGFFDAYQSSGQFPPRAHASMQIGHGISVCLTAAIKHCNPRERCGNLDTLFMVPRRRTG